MASAWQDLSKVPKKPFLITAANIPCYEEHFVNQVESEEEPWFTNILRWKVTASTYVRHCKACQYHDNKSHLPAVELHPTTPSWPFSVWGIDIIGKITPAASNGHQYILVAVDYFFRRIEAQSYKTLTAKQVARFIEQNIFCRYGVPHHIVTDNGSHFQVNGQMVSHFQAGHGRPVVYYRISRLATHLFSLSTFKLMV
ncbi:protein NYNRIN-like [Jatropha curcas]|uniref:protein NYNRIN-like n=1 Tax=Jatropha curcas TaxID=180498 RepID=UPI0018937A75|nr:protein NYNRIN-like [Jatropha curcas]